MNNEINDFVDRLFNIESEIKLLREDKKQLIKDLKDEVDVKLVLKVIALVKAKLRLGQKEVKEIENIVTNKINKIM